MTDQTRAKKGRRSRRSASQLFLAALVVFGIVASVLLLFSENVQWMRVGVLSALWAAVIGAFAMTKYRREAAADHTRAKDLQTVYELQLAREIAARREYELNVEAKVREETRLEADDVAALRNELAALRQNLQVLFDGNLPTERVALRAEAIRMQELGGRGYGSYQPARSGLYVPGSSTSAGVAGVGTPYDEPVTAETSVVYPEDPDEMPRATAERGTSAPEASSDLAAVRDAGVREAAVQETAVQETAVQDDASGRSVAHSQPYGAPRPAAVNTPPVSPFTAYDFEQTRRPTAEPSRTVDSDLESSVRTGSDPAQQAGVESDDGRTYRAVAEDTTGRTRRERRQSEPDVEVSGAHSNGRSVAEIMAGLHSGNSEDAAVPEVGARRRRRRAE